MGDSKLVEIIDKVLDYYKSFHMKYAEETIPQFWNDETKANRVVTFLDSMFDGQKGNFIELCSKWITEIGVQPRSLILYSNNPLSTCMINCIGCMLSVYYGHVVDVEYEYDIHLSVFDCHIDEFSIEFKEKLEN